jgi:hypothetical protein
MGPQRAGFALITRGELESIQDGSEVGQAPDTDNGPINLKVVVSG